MNWPHDDNASLIAFYGDPSKPGWQAQNLVPVIPPWRMTYGLVTVQYIMFHKLAAPSLERVFAAIWQYVGQDQNALNDTGLQNYSGAFNARMVRGSVTKKSDHNFAAAIDFDAAREPMNYSHKSNMAAFVIAAFKNEGWFWGGDFQSRQDPMHFQAAKESP